MLQILKKVTTKINFVAHPIGVGMFSDEQFVLWINEAKTIAMTYKTIIIGVDAFILTIENIGITIMTQL